MTMHAIAALHLLSLHDDNKQTNPQLQLCFQLSGLSGRWRGRAGGISRLPERLEEPIPRRRLAKLQRPPHDAPPLGFVDSLAAELAAGLWGAARCWRRLGTHARAISTHTLRVCGFAAHDLRRGVEVELVPEAQVVPARQQLLLPVRQDHLPARNSLKRTTRGLRRGDGPYR